MRNKIKTAALDVFDQNGFYRSGIRDIAALAGCSLPTLYYHYKNKDNLFEVVVCDAYQAMITQIEEQLPEGLPLKDTCYFTILQQIMLDGDDKKIMRLAYKTMLGVDGNQQSQTKLKMWNNEKQQKQIETIKQEGLHEYFGKLIFRVTNNMLEQALLEDNGLDGEKIKNELDYLFKLIKK